MVKLEENAVGKNIAYLEFSFGSVSLIWKHESNKRQNHQQMQTASGSRAS